MEFEYCCDFDIDGNVCGEIAEIRSRQVHESTDGPTEHKQIRCLNGHTYTSVGKMIGNSEWGSTRQTWADLEKLKSVLDL